jgi:hypothetical protein
MALVALFPAIAASQGIIKGRGSELLFFSNKYAFTIAVPRGWGVSGGSDTPVFFYAPPSERFIQASIPKGGAVITVEPRDAASGKNRLDTTPEAWALEDLHLFASGSPAIEPFTFPKESRVSRAVICSYEEPTFSPDQQVQQSVAIFWEFDNTLFVAHLNYNANDSIGLVAEKAFMQTVRSIRPIQKH